MLMGGLMNSTNFDSPRDFPARPDQMDCYLLRSVQIKEGLTHEQCIQDLSVITSNHKVQH